MAIKKHKPYTPSQRFTVLSSFEEITDKAPERSLIKPMKSKAGRNSAGRITVRHRGGGHKRRYRVVDFKRDKHGIPAKVAAIEYDPNRSANLALLYYADGEKRYVLASAKMQPGMTVISGPSVEAAPGNCLQIKNIPLGLMVHNIELNPGRGGKIVRSAGAGAQLMSRDEGYAQIKMPSGEIRLISENCFATVGRVGNIEHEGRAMGKAGRARWKGRRPTVRGVAMNPVDHPMGGGEGRTSGGGHPVSPWGQLAKGKRTRKKKKASSQFIIKRRK